MTENNILSEREEQILQLVAKGMTNREIAQVLSISPNTVKVHLSNVFEKLGVASRTEATLYGIEHGIVAVPGNEKEEATETPQDQPSLRKYLLFGIPAVILVIAAVLFGIFGRDWFFPRPTPTPMNPQVFAEMEDRWQELAPMPEARTGLAATAYDGNIYAIAGEGPDGVSGSVFRYLTEDDRWERLTPKPTSVRDVEAALIGEKIYVPGGLLADGNPTDILEIYDPRADSWSSGAPLPEPVSAYAMADFEGQLYLFGGWDGEKALDSVYIYDPGTDEWREGTPMAIPRQDAVAATIQDKIMVLGGQNNRGTVSSNEIYQPSREGAGEEIWMTKKPLENDNIGLGIQSIGDILFIVLQNEKYEIQVFQYVIQSDSWLLSNNNFRAPLIPGWAATSVADHIYIIGSAEADNNMTGCLYRYKAIYITIFPNIEY